MSSNTIAIALSTVTLAVCGYVAIVVSADTTAREDALQAQLDEANDRLYVYTDGLIEAEDAEGVEFGARRLAAEVAAGRRVALPDSVEAVEWAAKNFAGGRLHDDLSILALEMKTAS